MSDLQAVLEMLWHLVGAYPRPSLPRSVTDGSDLEPYHHAFEAMSRLDAAHRQSLLPPLPPPPLLLVLPVLLVLLVAGAAGTGGGGGPN